MKSKTVLYLVVVLNILLLFSCGKCGGVLNIVAMDREPPVNDKISFSFLQHNTDTIDVFYNALLSSKDLKLFVLNGDIITDTILFYASLDTVQERTIIHPSYLCSKPYIGNINIEFRFTVSSVEHSIPILFTQTIDKKDECNKRNTVISNIIINSTNHSIQSIDTSDFNGNKYIDNYITLILRDPL